MIPLSEILWTRIVSMMTVCYQKLRLKSFIFRCLVSDVQCLVPDGQWLSYLALLWALPTPHPILAIAVGLDWIGLGIVSGSNNHDGCHFKLIKVEMQGLWKAKWGDVRDKWRSKKEGSFIWSFLFEKVLLELRGKKALKDSKREAVYDDVLAKFDATWVATTSSNIGSPNYVNC